MNVNKIFIGGRLVNDPKLSFLPSQTEVTEFSIAVNRHYTGKDGSKKEEACFFDVVSYGSQATTLNKYLDKGSEVFIEGRMKQDTWKTAEGKNRSKFRVIVENFQFIGGKPESKPETETASFGDNDDIPF